MTTALRFTSSCAQDSDAFGFLQLFRKDARNVAGFYSEALLLHEQLGLEAAGVSDSKEVDLVLPASK